MAVNEREQEVLGYKQETLLSQSLLTLVPDACISKRSCQLLETVVSNEDKVPATELEVFDAGRDVTIHGNGRDSRWRRFEAFDYGTAS